MRSSSVELFYPLEEGDEFYTDEIFEFHRNGRLLNMSKSGEGKIFGDPTKKQCRKMNYRRVVE